MSNTPSLWEVTIKGCCPRCGKTSLFQGWYKRVDKCPSCNLEYKGEDSADGPAYVSMVITGLVVTVLALFTEFAYAPPFWLHALLWLPLILLLSFVVLRLAKSFFISLEFKSHRGVFEEEREEQ